MSSTMNPFDSSVTPLFYPRQGRGCDDGMLYPLRGMLLSQRPTKSRQEDAVKKANLFVDDDEIVGDHDVEGTYAVLVPRHVVCQGVPHNKYQKAKLVKMPLNLDEGFTPFDFGDVCERYFERRAAEANTPWHVVSGSHGLIVGVSVRRVGENSAAWGNDVPRKASVEGEDTKPTDAPSLLGTNGLVGQFEYELTGHLVQCMSLEQLMNFAVPASLGGCPLIPRHLQAATMPGFSGAKVAGVQVPANQDGQERKQQTSTETSTGAASPATLLGSFTASSMLDGKKLETHCLWLHATESATTSTTKGDRFITIKLSEDAGAPLGSVGCDTRDLLIEEMLKPHQDDDDDVKKEIKKEEDEVDDKKKIVTADVEGDDGETAASKEDLVPSVETSSIVEVDGATYNLKAFVTCLPITTQWDKVWFCYPPGSNRMVLTIANNKSGVDDGNSSSGSAANLHLPIAKMVWKPL